MDIEKIAKVMFEAVNSGDWAAVAGAALVLIVAGIRLYGQKVRGALPDENIVDKALTWLLESKPGGWVLNILTAISGAMGTALLAGAPITFSIIKAALLTALSGAALWELLKDVLGWWTAKKALEAGAAAAGAIKTSKQALDAVNDRTGKPF